LFFFSAGSLHQVRLIGVSNNFLRVSIEFEISKKHNEACKNKLIKKSPMHSLQEEWDA